MILQFRTERNTNGNARYLGIDTNANCYSTQPIGFICKDFYKLSVKDYKELLEQCKRNELKRVEYI